MAFYAVAGDGELDAGSVRKGQICYFVYADEHYCAIWQASDGWTGDAYRTIQ